MYPPVVGDDAVSVPREMLMYVVITTCVMLVAAVVIVWPVGLGSSNHKIADWNFMVFEGLYTCVTFPVLYLQLEVNLGPLPVSYVIGALVLGQLLIQGFFVIAFTTSQGSMGLNRAVGAVIYTAVLMAMYWWRTCRYGLISPSREGIDSAPFVDENCVNGTSLDSHCVHDVRTANRLLVERFFASNQNAVESEWYHSPLAKTPLASMLLVTMLTVIMWGVYFWAQWCAIVYFADHQNESLIDMWLRFALFVGVLECGGWFGKRSARVLDTLKCARFDKCSPADLPQFATVSAEMMAEILVAYFYAAFYRAIFGHLASWTEFVALCGAHLLLLVIINPLRMTQLYFDVTQKFTARVANLSPLLSAIVSDPSNRAQWNTRIAIDFAARFFASQIATATLLLANVFVRFGYNNNWYSYIGEHATATNYGTGMGFIAGSSGIDVVGALVVAFASRKMVQGGLLRPFTLLLRNRRMYFVFFVASGGHVATDVFLAKLKL